MEQIVSGLGLDAMIYTRKNPTGMTINWTVSPDASKVLTLSPGDYTKAQPIFSSKDPLSANELNGNLLVQVSHGRRLAHERDTNSERDLTCRAKVQPCAAVHALAALALGSRVSHFT